jgi:GTPase SAR1 family protein
MFEGHTGTVKCAAISPDGNLIASKSDETVRLWQSTSGSCLAEVAEPSRPVWPPGLAFHTHYPLLAVVGSDPGTPLDNCDRLLHIYEFDIAVLLGQPAASQTSHYVNAKVVLLGDTGVGKSGLSLVLNGQTFEATDSTPGRKVWTFQSQQVELDKNLKQTRETLLWDMAGQPGYRVIHQLHLNEVAVAVVVFDARSEIDPLAGVRHWGRALHLARQRQGAACVPLKMFLVSARADRGTVSVSKERLEALLQEFGFAGYFETSAKSVRKKWRYGATNLKQIKEHANRRNASWISVRRSRRRRSRPNACSHAMVRSTNHRHTPSPLPRSVRRAASTGVTPSQRNSWRVGSES